MYPRLLASGFVIWAVATVALRLRGEQVLRPDNWIVTGTLFVISFPLMAWVARRLCARAKLPAERWLAGGLSVALPTLLLDPFSAVFFPTVFPNMSPNMAGVFGGWMLWCCAGALIGVSVWVPRPR